MPGFKRCAGGGFAKCSGGGFNQCPPPFNDDPCAGSCCQHIYLGSFAVDVGYSLASNILDVATSKSASERNYFCGGGSLDTYFSGNISTGVWDFDDSIEAWISDSGNNCPPTGDISKWSRNDSGLYVPAYLNCEEYTASGDMPGSFLMDGLIDPGGTGNQTYLDLHIGYSGSPSLTVWDGTFVLESLSGSGGSFTANYTTDGTNLPSQNRSIKLADGNYIDDTPTFQYSVSSSVSTTRFSLNTGGVTYGQSGTLWNTALPIWAISTASGTGRVQIPFLLVPT